MATVAISGVKLVAYVSPKVVGIVAKLWQSRATSSIAVGKSSQL